MRFSKLTDAQLERLAILSEELGEAQQVIGKIIRHGYESFDPNRSEEPFIETEGTNRSDLEEELGDIVCAIEMLSGSGDISRGRIESRAEEKSRKIKPYLHHQAEVNG